VTGNKCRKIVVTESPGEGPLVVYAFDNIAQLLRGRVTARKEELTEDDELLLW
jgi:hypothetical protein